jgi:two-component system response regulator RegA
MSEESNTIQDRFLLVDDDATFCSVLGTVLMRRGYLVETANNAREAMRISERFKPTHAAIDLKLGGDSGLHLVEPLLRLNKEMKIIVITGYGSIPTAVQAIKAGAVNYVAKPLDVDTLLSAFEAGGNELGDESTATPMSLKRLEWEHIQRVLDEHDGNISATARSLGMHRRTLQRKLQKRPVKR